MHGNAYQHKTFVVVSLAFVTAVLVLCGLMFDSWLLYVCAGLTALGALGAGLGRAWGTYAAAGALALGVGGLVYYRTAHSGTLRGVGSAIYLLAILIGVYNLQARQRDQRKRKVQAARETSQATGDALEALAEGKPPVSPPPMATEDSPDAEASPKTFRSIVLLTRGRSQLDVPKATERLSRWLNVQFSQGKDEADNFFVGDGNVFMVKLHTQHIYMITLLNRPYWDSENIEPYEAYANLRGEPSLAEEMRRSQGAILIDAHLAEVGPASEKLLCMAKLAAACISSNTAILLSPAAWKAERVTSDLAKSLYSARDAADLLGPLCSFFPMWHEGKVRCMTRGLSLLGLPDVLTVAEDNEKDFNRGMVAVQSIAAYQANLGKALPVGDTCTVPESGSYRVERDSEAENVICLMPIEDPHATQQ